MNDIECHGAARLKAVVVCVGDVDDDLTAVDAGGTSGRVEEGQVRVVWVEGQLDGKLGNVAVVGRRPGAYAGRLLEQLLFEIRVWPWLSHDREAASQGD